MLKQYKELVATPDYIVALYDNKSIDVYHRYENAKGALREISEENDFEYDDNWNTRQFGKKLIDELGGGAPSIAGETYCVYVDSKGTVICGNMFDGSTKEGLRTVAGAYKFKYDEGWNTQQFGKKLLEFLKEKGY